MLYTAIGERGMRGLLSAWTAGLVLFVLIPLIAYVYERFDHRPAFVMEIFVSAERSSAEKARRDERAAVDAVAFEIAHLRLPPPEVRSENERATGSGSTHVAQRSLVVRTDSKERLSALADRTRSIDDATPGDPRRALRLSDLAFAFVLLALLLSISSLERPALSDAGPFATRASSVVLNMVALALLAAGAAIVAHGWNAPMALSVAAAVAPIVAWLARARVRWTADPMLRSRYAAIAVLTAGVAIAWLARLSLPVL